MAKLVSIRRTKGDQLYLPEILRGLSITLRHFFINVFTRKKIATIRYPEETRTYPPRFRGVHRLMKREDGTIRCVACMMCSTYCPAHCITIVAGERLDGTSVEKYPVSFDIDELICVNCGLCVEACPCDAIRMDTAIHFPPVERRRDARMNKAQLFARGSQSIARQGGLGPNWREVYRELLEAQAIYDTEDKYSASLRRSTSCDDPAPR